MNYVPDPERANNAVRQLEEFEIDEQRRLQLSEYARKVIHFPLERVQPLEDLVA